MTVSFNSDIAAVDANGTALADHASERGAAAAPRHPATRPPTLADEPARRTAREWICLDAITLSPVVDGASRHLYAARKALHRGSPATAAGELHAVAAELGGHAIRAAKRAGAAACVDWRLADFASWRLKAVAVKLDTAADSIEREESGCDAELSALIDACAWTDVERRWLVADECLWYPVCAEAQGHFEDAIEAYTSQNCGKAAIDVHKAIGYLRLEAGRASGYAKRALDGAVAELGKVALSVASGASCGRGAMGRCFSIANLSLALAHRTKAAEWWAHGVRRTTGYELKAAALCLECAARWVHREATTSAIRAAEFAANLGERLAVGESAARNQVTETIASFCVAVEALGSRIAPGP